MSNSNSTKSNKGKRGPNGAALVPVTVEAAPALPELTDMQRAFVAAYVAGQGTAGDATASVVAAGYSEKSARHIAADLLAKPHVVAAIDAALRDEIGQTLTVQAVGVIRKVLTDDTASLKLRSECALRVVEFSGLVERAKLQKAKETGLDGGKKLTEMSRDELAALIRNGAAVLQAAAHLPPAGPVIEGHKAQDYAQEVPAAAE